MSHGYPYWNINSNIHDISVTIAHEMGHYLGLHHCFTENENGDMGDSCADTDFCEDTPSYNRIEYQDTLGREVAKMVFANGGGLSVANFHTLTKRTNPYMLLTVSLMTVIFLLSTSQMSSLLLFSRMPHLMLCMEHVVQMVLF